MWAMAVTQFIPPHTLLFFHSQRSDINGTNFCRLIQGSEVPHSVCNIYAFIIYASMSMIPSYSGSPAKEKRKAQSYEIGARSRIHISKQIGRLTRISHIMKWTSLAIRAPKVSTGWNVTKQTM